MFANRKIFSQTVKYQNINSLFKKKALLTLTIILMSRNQSSIIKIKLRQSDK